MVIKLGVVPAVQKTLKFAGLSMSKIRLRELNEAFAAQIAGCNRELEIDKEIISVKGPGIFPGHPVGQIGARIITTLLHEMTRRDLRYGVASICTAGGSSVAIFLN